MKNWTPEGAFLRMVEMIRQVRDEGAPYSTAHSVVGAAWEASGNCIGDRSTYELILADAVNAVRYTEDTGAFRPTEWRSKNTSMPQTPILPRMHEGANLLRKRGHDWPRIEAVLAEVWGNAPLRGITVNGALPTIESLIDAAVKTAQFQEENPEMAALAQEICVK